MSWTDSQELREVPRMQELMKCNYIDATALDSGQKSLYINAAIQGEGGHFSNAPFIVDLQLSRRESEST
jgi:hypothetical protein